MSGGRRKQRRKNARERARAHPQASGTTTRILVKIERDALAHAYQITVAAGQVLPPEIARRGTIVAVDRPKWFWLTQR
jgi:hypothetical protein